jgi:hypothetical protein
LGNTDHIYPLSFVVKTSGVCEGHIVNYTLSASHENFAEFIQQEVMKDMYFIEVTDYIHFGGV